MVEYTDGSIIAQLGAQDMKLPIQYALNYEKRENLIADTRSSNNDTKSSMGDKYETGREMLQQEINRLQNQANVFIQQRDFLKKISTHENSKVETGTLVETDKGWFYLSVSLGEFQFEGKKIFAISPETPLAIAMLNKKVGDNIVVNQMQQKIKSIY